MIEYINKYYIKASPLILGETPAHLRDEGNQSQNSSDAEQDEDQEA
jgi:hypothetical protein